jgi:hypothetical protein
MESLITILREVRNPRDINARHDVNEGSGCIGQASFLLQRLSLARSSKTSGVRRAIKMALALSRKTCVLLSRSMVLMLPHPELRSAALILAAPECCHQHGLGGICQSGSISFDSR